MSKVAERKIMNEKIAKVREVVHGVCTNDIILALYSLDMNVEKTIQAFCEDGASEVLDDWVRPAGGSSKNKNKKKKNKQQVEPQESAVAPPVAAATAAAVPSTASASKAAKVCIDNVCSACRGTFIVWHRRSFSIRPLPAIFQALRAAVTDLAETTPRGAPAAPTAATGMPKAVSPVQAAAIKHATSQSSISSSLGADSGVNLSPTHKEEKKPASESKPKPAKVVSGGIMMQSDALTAEQLEALQRSLTEQLAACGIDASILSGVAGGDMPVRRPRKADGPRRGGIVKNERTSIRPQLSIL
ncbi:unnamed protein product [Haemonchus placei]|uniref:CUE domain-containing protein n=1 Tax=Haemonchus placei TaxID=6290 RepID=A0A0N4WBU2_HAEPC|nr:unnamed protein product [Haemonchus placei]